MTQWPERREETPVSFAPPQPVILGHTVKPVSEWLFASVFTSVKWRGPHVLTHLTF